MAGLPVADHFVQREREMVQLEKFSRTAGHGDHRRRKVFVVHGLGGMLRDSALRGIRTAAQRRLHSRLLAGQVVEGRAQAVPRRRIGESDEAGAFTGGAASTGRSRCR